MVLTEEVGSLGRGKVGKGGSERAAGVVVGEPSSLPFDLGGRDRREEGLAGGGVVEEGVMDHGDGFSGAIRSRTVTTSSHVATTANPPRTSNEVKSTLVFSQIPYAKTIITAPPLVAHKI